MTVECSNVLIVKFALLSMLLPNTSCHCKSCPFDKCAAVVVYKLKMSSIFDSSQPADPATADAHPPRFMMIRFSSAFPVNTKTLGYHLGMPGNPHTGCNRSWPAVKV